MDENIRYTLDTIISACKNWVNHHHGETLNLDYNSVDQLYNLLLELKEIIDN